MFCSKRKVKVPIIFASLAVCLYLSSFFDRIQSGFTKSISTGSALQSLLFAISIDIPFVILSSIMTRNICTQVVASLGIVAGIVSLFLLGSGYSVGPIVLTLSSTFILIGSDRFDIN